MTERIKNFVQMYFENIPYSEETQQAQKKIETNNYGIRENLLKYDEVMNEQRKNYVCRKVKRFKGRRRSRTNA